MSLTMNIDDEWSSFLSNKYEETSSDDDELIGEFNENKLNSSETFGECPVPTDIYISTKSKIAYLNQEIDLRRIFWNIPVIPYAKPCNGVIKKQMKFILCFIMARFHFM